MDQNENLSNLIKKEANTSLNFYNKIIPETKLTVKDLIDKASEIEKKLSNNKNNLDSSENELIHSNSKHRETINNSYNNNNNNILNMINLENKIILFQKFIYTGTKKKQLLIKMILNIPFLTCLQMRIILFFIQKNIHSLTTRITMKILQI